MKYASLVLLSEKQGQLLLSNFTHVSSIGLAKKGVQLHAPEHAPKIHFGCSVNAHLQQNYSTSHF